MADVKHTPAAGRIFIDSFSGKVADLPKSHRTTENILKTLDKHPRVSTWDMEETVWLRSAISDLKKLGLIVSDPNEPYPWHRYTPLARALRGLQDHYEAKAQTYRIHAEDLASGRKGGATEGSV